MIDPYILVQWQWGTKLQEFHIALCSVSHGMLLRQNNIKIFFFWTGGGGDGVWECHKGKLLLVSKCYPYYMNTLLEFYVKG